MENKNGPARKLVRPGTATGKTRPVTAAASETNSTETSKNGSSSSFPKEILEKFPPEKTPLVSTSKPGRLPSLRGERDLTLGGARPGPSDGGTKTTKFTPNVKRGTVRRGNTAQETATPAVEEKKTDGHGRGRGGRDGSTRGRGRGRPELIQTSGSIFGEGIADLAKHGSGGSTSYREKESSGSASAMERPRLNPKASKVDKEEEDATLNALMRDDFVDYGFGDSGDNESVMLPIQLPKSCQGSSSKKEGELVLKTESLPNAAIKIKQEKLDGEEETKLAAASEKTGPDYERRTKPSQISAQEMFSTEGDIIFVQLPDVLPSLRPEKERPSTVKLEPGTVQEIPDEQPVTEESQPGSGAVSAFDDIPEGRIGTLRVHQSGKLTLQMGDHSFVLDAATQVSFLQDLISVEVNAEEKQGKMTALGPIKYKGVCLPDWEQLIEDL